MTTVNSFQSTILRLSVVYKMNSEKRERKSLFICPRRPNSANVPAAALAAAAVAADIGCAAKSNETTCYYGTIKQRRMTVHQHTFVQRCPLSD